MRLIYACLLMSLLAGCAGQKPEPKEVKLADERRSVQELQFDTKYYDAVDKWVAFEGDSSNLFGFIYIDVQAGFTLNFEGRLIVTDNGLKDITTKTDTNNIFKFRLGENTADVAVLSDEQIKQLGLPKMPDWMKFYKPSDENTYLVGIGYSFNHVGMSSRAIEPLLKVYEKEPHFERVEFELAYAYNAMDNYDKAIDVLDKAIKNNPKNFLYYKELVFAFMAQGKPDEAEKACLQGFELDGESELKAETAFNVAVSYFRAKNKPKFEKWAKLSKEYTNKDSQIYKYLNRFEENWEE